MGTVRIAGRTYSDPDVIALSAAAGGLVDPRSAVLHQARKVNAEYRKYDPGFGDPLQRMQIIASLLGIRVTAMNIERRRDEQRDAILLQTPKGPQILYNPDRPPQRVAFSLGHEISHTFFPSTSRGARFRNIHESDSKEANELERLCDLGGAELLMPIEDFQRVAAGDYSLTAVERLSTFFGSSYEATVYRLATAHPGIAVAGLLQYRLTLPEVRLLAKEREQRTLFSDQRARASELIPKYRRQSLHLSGACDARYRIHWNKSFEQESVIYKASEKSIRQAIEELPNQSGKVGRLEATVAPYQREDANIEFGDVLFFWTEEAR